MEKRLIFQLFWITKQKSPVKWASWDQSSLGRKEKHIYHKWLLPSLMIATVSARILQLGFFIRRLNGASYQIRKIADAHAPGMPATLSPPPRVSDPDIHHSTCVTHVSWCMPGSLTSGFLWSLWQEKRSRHSRRMRNLQFYVFGKRPMVLYVKPKQRMRKLYQILHSQSWDNGIR